MAATPLHRRPRPTNAPLAWLLAILHLSVFTAAGWHTHADHDSEPGHTARLAVPHDSCDHDHTDHDHSSDHDNDPHDSHHDSCALCDAILALSHAAPTPSPALALDTPDPASTPDARRSMVPVARIGEFHARGPPEVPARL